MTATIRDMLGLTEADQLFKAGWVNHGFPAFKGHDQTAEITPTIQQMFSDPANQVPHFFQKKLREITAKRTVRKDAVDATLLEDSIPIVFDPEILQILREEAPLVARLPTEGWNGYKVIANRIDNWAPPHGFTNEASAIDMSGIGGKTFTIDKVEEAMKIFYDKVVISDFTRMAGDFYMPVRDTALGARIAAHYQWKEQAVLYGDPSQALIDGSPGSINAYKGLATTATTIDKSGVDISEKKACIQDIKKEIANILQAGKGISKTDMEVWTSWSMLDYLSNEVDVSERIIIGEPGFNYGFETVRISGVPVIATHNVDVHTYDDGTNPPWTVGAIGDVFLVNKRAFRFRALAPLSTIPLARIGLAEQSALYEFGTTIDRANGQWTRYLSNYQI